jgi:hypothetical protein
MTQLAETTEFRPPAHAALPLQPVDDPAVWSAADLAASDDWIYPLTGAETGELDAAVAHLEATGKEIMDIGRGDFALPTLGSRLAAVREQVLHGRGLALVRGVPVARYTRRQSAIAFWCIGLHIGVPVSQNARGHVLGHVADLGNSTLKNPSHRGYHTRETLPYHSDSCDVVGLLCLHAAKAGGMSLVTSSLAVHNGMLERRPDCVEALAGMIYRDRRGEIPEGKRPWFRLPVFNTFAGYLSVSWQGGYIRSAERFDELPERSPVLAEALDLFTQLANELAFSMELRQGDIQFLHNHVTVHSRTEFEDCPEPERRRHLLRLWLATPGGRPLPPVYRDRYAHLGPGDRPAGGIVVPGTRFKAPLEAE